MNMRIVSWVLFTGCWLATAAAQANFTAPLSDVTTGNYTVSWNYTAQSSCNGGSYNPNPYRVTEQKVGSTTINTYNTGSSLSVSGRTEGSYVYKVWTYLCSSSGNDYYYRGSLTVNVLKPVPSGPFWTNLEQTGDAQLSLRWGEVPGADKIQIFESKNGSVMAQIYECFYHWECQRYAGGFTFNRQVDTGRYRYQIRGVNSTGNGALVTSQEFTIVVVGSETPLVPNITDNSVDPADDTKTGATYAGLIPGNYDVNNNGAFNYSIPIDVPPGINGLQPDVALTYNSQNNKNGILGWGWGLKGSSGIGRCPADPIRDGYHSGIMPGDHYKFCLDGQRLVEVADREYRTEAETFSRIRSYGGTKQAPEYWVVEFKNGRKASYGWSHSQYDSVGDRRYWFIAKLEDAAGNTLFYTYSKGSTTLSDGTTADWARLNTIRYAYGDNGQYSHHLYFEYEDRPDVRTEYVAGRQFIHSKRMSRIDVSSGGALVKSYSLKYQQYDDYTLRTTAQVSRLTLVTMCGRFDGITWQCLPGKEITWSQERDEPGFGKVEDRRYFDTADFRGTGKLQSIEIEKSGSTYYVYVFEEDSPSNRQLWLTTTSTLYRRPVFYDLDGDGRDDIVFEGGGDNAPWFAPLVYLKSTGTSFEYRYIGRPGKEIEDTYGDLGHRGDKPVRKITDVNGDGLRDIVFIAEPHQIGIQVKLNLGNGNFSAWNRWYGTDQPGWGFHYQWQFGDVNGDSLVDIFDPKTNGVLINNGSGFQHEFWEGADVIEPSIPGFRMMADFNGDGLDDILHSYGGNDAKIQLSTGSGFTPKTRGFEIGGYFSWGDIEVEFERLEGPSITDRGYVNYLRFSFVDINGDGCADLSLMRLGDSGSSPMNGERIVAFSSCSTEIGFRPFVSWHKDVTVPADVKFPEDNLLSQYSSDSYWEEVYAQKISDRDRDGALEIYDAKYQRHLKQKLRQVSLIRDYTDYRDAQSDVKYSRHLAITYGGVSGAASRVAEGTYNDPNYQDSGIFPASGLAPRAGTNFSVRNHSLLRTQIVNSIVENEYRGTLSDNSIVKHKSMIYAYQNYRVNTQGLGGLGFGKMEEKTAFGLLARNSNGLPLAGQERVYQRKITYYAQEISNDSRLAGVPIYEAMYTGKETGYQNLDEEKVYEKDYEWKVRVYSDDIDRHSDGHISPHYFPYKVRTTTKKYDGGDTPYATVSDSAYFGAGCLVICNKVSKISQDEDFTANGIQRQQTVSVWDGNSPTVVKTTVKSDFRDIVNSSSWVLGLPGRVVTTASLLNTLGGTDGQQSRTMAYTYNTKGQIETETTEPDVSSLYLRKTYTYNRYGTRDSETLSWNTSTNDGLAFGNSSRSTTSEVRNSNGTAVITKTDAANNRTIITFDALTSKDARIEDPNGRVATTTYDALGRIRSETFPGNVVATRDYRRCDSCFDFNPSATWYVSIKKSGASAMRMYFDASDREVGTRTKDLKGRFVYTYKLYDDAGRLVEEAAPFYDGDMPELTHYYYDTRGRLDSVTFPDGSEESYEYEGLAREVTNREGQTSSLVKNALDWPVETVDNEGTKVKFTYWPFGEPRTTVVDDNPATKISMEYDKLGRKTKIVDPNSGTTISTYNPLGLVASETNANNFVTRFSYDAVGRMVKRTDDASGSAKTHTWAYDTKTYGKGLLGSLSGVDSDGETYSENFEYNHLGLLRTHVKRIKGRNYTSVAHYDRYNRDLGLTYPSGFTIKNVHNAYGYLDKVQRNSDGKTLWEARDVDALGHLKEFVLGNGVVTTRKYDAASGRIESIRAQKSGFDIQYQAFEFSPLGNLERKIDYRANTDERYCYDAMNRLEECSDLTRNEYDALGNISKKGSNSYQYTTSRPHAVTSALGNSYQYDAAGQMTSGANRTIQYTPNGMPYFIRRDSNEVHIAYAPDRSRIESYDSRSDTTTTYVNLANYEISKTDTSIKRVHYIGDFAQFISETQVGSTVTTREYFAYLHRDHQGSIVAESDDYASAAANIAWLGFDAWGKVTTGLGKATNRGYTDHEHLSAVGLVHMNGRVFDPELARFLTPDPLVQAPLSSQSYNRYSYVFNNPQSFTDPSGYQVEEEVVVTFDPPIFTFDLTPSLSFDGFVNFTISMPGLDMANAMMTDLEGNASQSGGGFEYYDGDLPCWDCPITPREPDSFWEKVGDGATEAWRLSEGIPVGGQAIKVLKFATLVVVAKREFTVFSGVSKFSIQSFDNLKKLTKGTGLEAHHLIEKRFAVVLGVKPGEMASIALTKADHQAFTNAWRQAIPYGQGTANATRDQILNAARQIYKDYPEIIKALNL